MEFPHCPDDLPGAHIEPEADDLPPISRALVPPTPRQVADTLNWLASIRNKQRDEE